MRCEVRGSLYFAFGELCWFFNVSVSQGHLNCGLEIVDDERIHQLQYRADYPEQEDVEVRR